jgi:hypothetical protein
VEHRRPVGATSGDIGPRAAPRRTARNRALGISTQHMRRQPPRAGPSSPGRQDLGDLDLSDPDLGHLDLGHLDLGHPHLGHPDVHAGLAKPTRPATAPTKADYVWAPPGAPRDPLWTVQGCLNQPARDDRAMPLWISGQLGTDEPRHAGEQGTDERWREWCQQLEAVEQVGPEGRGGGACSSGPTWFREPARSKPARQRRVGPALLRVGPWGWRLPWSRGGRLRRGLLVGWELLCR